MISGIEPHLRTPQDVGERWLSSEEEEILALLDQWYLSPEAQAIIQMAIKIEDTIAALSSSDDKVAQLVRGTSIEFLNGIKGDLEDFRQSAEREIDFEVFPALTELLTVDRAIELSRPTVR